MMGRYWAFVVVLTSRLVFSLLGYKLTQGARHRAPASGKNTESVLRTEDDTQTVLDNAVKAHGGEKTFTRWSCGYIKYKTNGGALTAQFGDVTLEDTFQLPEHFKRVTSVRVEGRDQPVIFVINHGKGWMKKGDAPAEPIDNNITEKPEHPFANFCNMAPLAERGKHLTKLSEETIDGGKGIGIRIRLDGIAEADFHFGKQDGLMLRAKQVLPGNGLEEPTVKESFFDDYKDVQGGKVPMRIRGLMNGTLLMGVTLLEVKFADAFRESEFVKP
jgi:hypothetical protein